MIVNGCSSVMSNSLARWLAGHGVHNFKDEGQRATCRGEKYGRGRMDGWNLAD